MRWLAAGVLIGFAVCALLRTAELASAGAAHPPAAATAHHAPREPVTVVFSTGVKQWRGLFAALHSVWLHTAEPARLRVRLLAEAGADAQLLERLLACALATLALGMPYCVYSFA